MVEERPIFTGDIFRNIQVYERQPAGKWLPRTINAIVLQHPCALRQGSILTQNILIAEIEPHPPVPSNEWKGRMRIMPLEGINFRDSPLGTEPVQTEESFAACFTKLQVVDSSQLITGNRVACMSRLGINFLMQRWVNHNSRVVVETFVFDQEIAPVFEEADLLEEWITELLSLDRTREICEQEFERWIKTDVNGRSRQDLLKEAQWRSPIRIQMRNEVQNRLIQFPARGQALTGITTLRSPG